MATPVPDPDGWVPLFEDELCEAPDEGADMLPLDPDSSGAPLVSLGSDPVTLPLSWAPLVAPGGAPDVPPVPTAVPLPVARVEALP